MILTTLNTQEEEVVLQRFKKLARDMCRSEIQDLVACTTTKTFSLIYACKQEKQRVNECLEPHSKQEILNKMRYEEILKKEQFYKQKNLYPKKNIE